MWNYTDVVYFDVNKVFYQATQQMNTHNRGALSIFYFVFQMSIPFFPLNNRIKFQNYHHVKKRWKNWCEVWKKKAPSIAL